MQLVACHCHNTYLTTCCDFSMIAEYKKAEQNQLEKQCYRNTKVQAPFCYLYGLLWDDLDLTMAKHMTNRFKIFIVANYFLCMWLGSNIGHMNDWKKLAALNKSKIKCFE